MEFKHKSPALNNQENNLQIRLLNWPDSYYREIDPKTRLALLDEADKANLTPEDNEVRRRLHRMRYSGKNFEKDLFLKAWLDIQYFAEASDGFIFRRKNPDRFRKIMNSIGVCNLEDKHYNGLIYEELVHLAMLYITLCEQDRSFNSLMLGLGHLSETSLRKKIRMHIARVAIEIPESYGVADEYIVWRQALTAAFDSACPDLAGTLGTS